MLGAIIGDTIGSVYEVSNVKKMDFPLFVEWSCPTDDSVMSIAVADWLLSDPERTQLGLEECMVKWGFKYPDVGYGPTFKEWLFSPYYKNMDLYAPYIEAGKEPEVIIQMTGIRRPYGSWGNGSAMRCSACGWVARTLEDALDLAARSAKITHNSPEGIRGAKATAAAIFMARHGASKEEIKAYIEENFYYDLSRDCEDIRPGYDFDVSCQGTLPAALAAFFNSSDYESAVRLAVSLGGDSDTIACITGGIAEAFYGEIPEAIITEARQRIPDEFWPIINEIKGVV